MRSSITTEAVLAVALLAIAGTVFAQVPAGAELLVGTVQSAGYPVAASDRHGNFVIVWNLYSPPASEVRGQLFAADGSLRGLQFRVNPPADAGWLAGPGRSVAMRPDGRFVVAWSECSNYCFGSDVRAQRFDANGTPAGSAIRVNTATTGWHKWPSVAMADHGRFIITWSASPPAANDDVLAQIFDTAGNRWGGEFTVNTYTTGLQQASQIGMDAQGNFVVVWQGRDNHDGDGIGVFGQRFRSDGSPAGGEFLVNTTTYHFQTAYGLAVAPDGQFIATWDSWGFPPPPPGPRRVLGQVHAADGSRIGTEFVLTQQTTGYRVAPSVAMDSEANFVVSWSDSLADGGATGVLAQRFHVDGSPRGAQFRVNTWTTGTQYHANVSGGEAGNVLVTWETFGPPNRMSAQRFGGLTPEILAVDTMADADSDGNRVLEPGETVDLRPSWRNVNGAAQTFSATLTNITGPAGATYAITDGAGDYGTVANGATAVCSNCYVASVSSPPARPSLHWDASARESIIPDSQGQQKRWRLHVGDSFTDVPRASGFYRFVETLLHHGVTGGCGGDAYCPTNATSREQMAVFVLVAKEGSAYAPASCGPTPMFADVPPGSGFCPWVEELARRGVVAGCGGGNYCPSAAVSRDQMAVFVLRTLDPTLSPPSCAPPNLFADVPETSGFCPWIEDLANRAIVTGCGGGNYCPAAPVTREQMGVFISATFGLALYGP